MTSTNITTRILLALLLAAAMTACGGKTDNATQAQSGKHAEEPDHENGGHEEGEAGHDEGAAATTPFQ